MLVDLSALIQKKAESIRAHATQTALIDCGRAVENLASYRSSLSDRNGYAEAFFFQTGSDLLRTFPEHP